MADAGKPPAVPKGISVKIDQKSECVKVAIRCRPLAQRERDAGEQGIVVMDEKRHEVHLLKPADGGGGGAPAGPPEPPKTFTFDHVYGPNALQKAIYDETARPIVQSVVDGYNGTVFAYGQTGTGKTHTMEGVMDDEVLRGIMPNSFVHIFDAVKDMPASVEFLVRASFLEIYLDDVFDLLNKEARLKLDVKENKDKGIFVKGLSTYVVKSVADLMKVLKRGKAARKVGATKMNEGSSRSHSILTITIETSESDAKGEKHYKVGKLNLVDLAGSERQKRTGAEGDRLDEGKAINLSLSALGNVIKALVTPGTKHIPFRDSKLTRLLQDSLGGNTKTVMIANLGPGALSYDETLSTLRYADRAKQIKNAPKINEDPKDAMLRQFQEEIQRLKAALEAKKRGMGGGAAGGVPALGPDGQPLEGEGPVVNADGSISEPGTVVQERVVEKVVVKDTGIKEEDLKQMKEKVAAEVRALTDKTEEEKQTIMREKLLAEQAAKLHEQELRTKQDLLEKERRDLEAMAKKLAEKQQQLVAGGAQLSVAAKQKADLKRAEEELKARHAEEERLRAELHKTTAASTLLNEHYQNAAQSVATLDAELRDTWTRITEKKSEMSDLVDEFELEHEELVATIRDLDRTMKLKNLVLNAFIPPAYVEAIESRAVWNEQGDEWVLPALDFAGNNVQRQVAAGASGAMSQRNGGGAYPTFPGFGAGDTRSAGLGPMGSSGLAGVAGAGGAGAGGGGANKEVFRSYAYFADPNAAAAAAAAAGPRPAARKPYK